MVLYTMVGVALYGLNCFRLTRRGLVTPAAKESYTLTIRLVVAYLRSVDIHRVRLQLLVYSIQSSPQQ